MAKPTKKKPAKKTPAKDQSQIALSVVERAIGGKLKENGTAKKGAPGRR